MDIRQFVRSKNISESRSVENNSDKRFQKWVLFNQHRQMREPQTQLLIVNSDVVETVTSETETWLKFRDKTETETSS